MNSASGPTTGVGHRLPPWSRPAGIILTSNKGFGEWGELLGDTVIASAVLDRLLHHSHVLNIRGASGRNGRRASQQLNATPQEDGANGKWQF